MLIFLVECDCSNIKVTVQVEDDDLEPEFCPLCSREVNAELIESSDE